MLELAVVERSYKIGKNWIFDKCGATGYKVIRKNGKIVDFIETYALVKNEKNDYDVKAKVENMDVPVGVIRKSIEILEKA